MDASKEYILMCERAVEVQELWQEKIATEKGGYISNGNLVKNEEHNFWVATRLFWNEPDFVVHRENENDYWWLPRQDQLQEMILNRGSHGYQNSGILLHLSLFADENKLNDVSMEQLWLAFVMHELYGKVWTGVDWKRKEE